MSIELKPINPNSGAYEAGLKFESEPQVSGDERPVIKIGESSLPAGAATAVNQTDGTQKTQLVDISGASASVGPRVQTPSGNALSVQIGPGDVISSIPVVLDYPHHQIHEGETWQYCYGPATMLQNAVVNLRVVVANVAATLRTPHVVAEIDSTGEAWLELFETPTYSAPGTAATFFNRNRNIAGSPTTTIFTAPTVSAAGTKLSGWIIGSGQKAGNATKDSVEWDLKTNTEYLYRITAQGALNVCFRLIEYEDKGV